jgi:hypothetical protein
LYVLQYADDTCLFLNNSSDIDKAIDIVIKSGKFSGLTLNVSKTKVMLLGNLNIQPCVKSNIQFSNEAEKCLGIYVGHNENLLEQKNWRDKIKIIEHMICTWKKIITSTFSFIADFCKIIPYCGFYNCSHF